MPRTASLVRGNFATRFDVYDMAGSISWQGTLVGCDIPVVSTIVQANKVDPFVWASAIVQMCLCASQSIKSSRSADP
jgi:uncharacterized membrane protein YjfL (UPF0719 family)